MCEVGIVLSELTYMIRRTPAFAADRRVRTPLAQFAARSYVKPSPYGTVLIMSPWNYPLLLTLDPLIDALAAGNTAVVKPSAYSPATSGSSPGSLAECFPRSMSRWSPEAGRRTPACWSPEVRLYLLHRQPGSGPGGPGSTPLSTSRRSPWSWEERAPASWTRLRI